MKSDHAIMHDALRAIAATDVSPDVDDHYELAFAMATIARDALADCADPACIRPVLPFAPLVDAFAERDN